MRKKKLFQTMFLVTMILMVSGCEKKDPEYVEVLVEDIDFENKFYYDQLSEAEQIVYGEVYQGILNGDSEICTHDIAPERANEIVKNIFYDFPKLFWIDGGAYSTQYEESLFEKGYTVVEPVYVYDMDERAAKNSEIETKAVEIIASVPEGYGEYDTIKYVYEYLVNSVDYVEDADDNQNIYSALVNQKSVCAGYARANQYLLNELGIYCIYVTGTAENEEGADAHAWNIVECNDQFYYVDTTWADPVIAGEASENAPMIYDYLCCSEAELGKTHTLDEGYDYPACDSEDLNYYRNHDMYYETADGDVILQAMKNTINQKEPVSIFKFADESLYAEGSEKIVNTYIEEGALYLGERYGLWEIFYSYEENPMLNKMVVHWFYE